MNTIIADPNILQLENFASLGKVIPIPGREWTPTQIKSANILLTRSVTKVNAELLDNSAVKFVGTATSGFDHIDRQYLDQQGIRFDYCPASNANSVAEYILSAILATLEPDQKLQELTAGVIGCGHVGSRVVELLLGVGIKCFLNDPPLQRQGDAGKYCSLEQVLACDVVTLHTPLITDGDFPTQDLIGKVELQQMKRDVIFINAARGGVVMEAALLQRIESNPEMKTVIDCWCGEPDININLLEKVTFGSPHIAGYSFDGKVRAAKMLYQSLCAFLNVANDKFKEQNTPLKQLDLRQFRNQFECLRMAVFSSYDIRRDSLQLMRSIEQSRSERMLTFDRLRKEYPQRREFYQTAIMTDLDQKVLTQLGFSIAS